MLVAPLVVALLAQAPAPSPDAPPAPASPARALRVGVASLEREGIEPRVAGVVEDSLLIELRKLARTSVIGMTEIRAMLDLEA
jgi:hypothetical protein